MLIIIFQFVKEIDNKKRMGHADYQFLLTIFGDELITKY